MFHPKHVLVIEYEFQTHRVVSEIYMVHCIAKRFSNVKQYSLAFDVVGLSLKFRACFLC